MRGLIGDRLLKRFIGDIRHQPRFGLPRLLDSRPDNGEATTNSSEMTEEKAQTRTPERDSEAMDAASENRVKPAVDENTRISQVWENSINGNADRA